ncbi:hypothetical protein ABPG72_018791 [Tetrahymena utriculariae]
MKQLKVENMMKKDFKKSLFSIYKVYEVNQMFNNYNNKNVRDFSICMLNENNPKVLYLVMEADTQKFNIISYQKQQEENEKLNYITDLVKINDQAVVCSHYDGSLVLYKNFSERQLKQNENEYQEIICKQEIDMHDMNQIIQFISVFSKRDQLIIMLEYFDGRVIEQHFTQNLIQTKLERNVTVKPKETFQFTFRKFLKEEQILCGFINKSKFGIIQASQDDILSLQKIQIYHIEDDVASALNMSTLNLVTFDAYKDSQILYIVCIYQNWQNNTQILCSFQLETALKLICCFLLNDNLGKAVQIVSVNQKQKECFQYDAIVLFQHKLIAYSWEYHISEALIMGDQNEEYKIYHFQVVGGLPFHLLISQSQFNQKKLEQVQYFYTFS